ncbi:MAG TPA: FTR1 family protein [Spirochaetia bacterium]|nr:FTR1 family protein [Spirochaetia bacterium]
MLTLSAGARKCAVLLLFLGSFTSAFAQSGDSSKTSILVPLERTFAEASGADWKHAMDQLQAFASGWRAAAGPATRQAQDVETALVAAQAALSRPAAGRAGPALADLAKALVAWREAAKAPGLDGGDAPFFGALAAGAAHGLDYVQDLRSAEAAAAMQIVEALWSIGEDAAHAADPAKYAAAEAGIDGSRAALEAQPPDLLRARTALTALVAALNGAPGAEKPASPSGKAPAPGIEDLVGRLQGVREALAHDDQRQAADLMQEFIAAWPVAEGTVKTRSEDAYRQTEEDMSAAAGLLMSGPEARARATTLVNGMIDRLGRLEQGGTVYTAWDAGLILLREGMEALLVLAALLAMLRKAGAPHGTGWIWSGAGVGILASCLLAVLLVFVVSAASAGNTRERMEGFVGLASVALMITVGAWLHRRSGLQSWNAFIKNRVGGALAAGSMWSLFSLACLAVLREGAESVVFYIGIAGSIPLASLLAGIGGALAVLVVVGFLIIRFSVRLPLRWFFLAATLLIYYLAFKIAGESLHALQVAGALSSHEETALPSVPALGMFRTWETFLPQAAVLLLVLSEMLITELKRIVGRGEAATARPAGSTN